MAIPRYDIIQRQIPASQSYTTSFEVLNYSTAGVQIAWSGINATNGTVRLRASCDGTNFQDLTQFPVTMVSGTDNHIFNMYLIGYSYMQLSYSPQSITTGTIDVVAVRKAF